MDEICFKVILKISVDDHIDVEMSKINEFDEIEECETLTDCIRSVIGYIKRNNLSQAQWDGGYVYYQNKYYGRILYDGMFYDATTEQAKLPTLTKQIEIASIKKDCKIKQNQNDKNYGE